MTQAPQGYAFAAVIEDDQGQAQVLIDYGIDDPFVFALPAANPKKPIRFAVGHPGLRSSLWRLWANRSKDDVYLATRQSAGIFKISLHESGDWRVQLVGQDRGDVTYTPLTDSEPEGRVLHRWKRPRPGPAGWTDALSIWVIDIDVAEMPGDAEPGHDAQWMQPPPAGGAVEFRIVFAPPGPVILDMSEAVRRPGGGLAYINGFRLAGGEAVLLFAATSLLDEAMLADIAQFRREHRMSVGPDFDLSPETGPRTAVITSDDDGYQNIWDLSLS